MSKLSVTFDGVACTPMRLEDPTKNFGSADVPSGTNAVITAAADHIARNHGKACTPALLDADAQVSKLTTLKSALSAVDTYSSANEEAKFVMDRSEVLNPTLSEKESRIDTIRGFSDEKAQQYMDHNNHPQEGEESKAMTLDEAKDALRRENGRVDTEDNSILADPTASEVTTLIINERKADIAQLQLDKILNDKLQVSLSPEIVTSGNATINSNLTTLTDSSATFTADSLLTTDIVKIGGYLCKVDSVTDDNNLELATPAKEISPAESYKILRDEFMSQFEFTTTE